MQKYLSLVRLDRLLKPETIIITSKILLDNLNIIHWIMNINKKFIDFKNFKNHTEAQQVISSIGFSGQMPFINYPSKQWGVSTQITFISVKVQAYQKITFDSKRNDVTQNQWLDNKKYTRRKAKTILTQYYQSSAVQISCH